MAILEDKQILALCRGKDDGSLIYPFSESLLQPCSYDLCLGDKFMVERLTLSPVELGHKEWRERQPHDGQITIWPKQLVLATTIECLRLRNRLCARITGRSSLGRMGIMVHATADHIDPGFHGSPTLQLYNLGWTPVTLRVGMPIAQVIFAKTEYLPKHGYGSPGLHSAYQGASRPTPAPDIFV